MGLALAIALVVRGIVWQWQVPTEWARIFMVAVWWVDHSFFLTVL